MTGVCHMIHQTHAIWCVWLRFILIMQSPWYLLCSCAVDPVQYTPQFDIVVQMRQHGVSNSISDPLPVKTRLTHLTLDCITISSSQSHYILPHASIASRITYRASMQLPWMDIPPASQDFACYRSLESTLHHIHARSRDSFTSHSHLPCRPRI